MCGIVGFTGHQQAAPILLEGLSRLEYRGYDSAGLAIRDGEKLAEVVKSTGKLRNLVVSAIRDGPLMELQARQMPILMSAVTVPTLLLAL